MAVYRVILLAPAADALASISDVHERDLVKDALGKLADSPDDPAPYTAKERKEGWELYVGRWKAVYEIRGIELVVYVHNIKEKPSLRFDYRR
jgi:mRNA-degrading endonuclease RelE of RelBE toxin-antitoxin system